MHGGAGAVGVCCAKLGEAEALAAEGVSSILITSPVVTMPGLQRLAALNPDVPLRRNMGHAELRPDADAEVEDWRDFRVPECLACGGVLKPDVVFFGEPVPRQRVEQAFAWCEQADALLVAGSSLTVMSGLRFARWMHKHHKPVIVINHGATRADELATVRIDASTSQALSAILAQ